MWTKENYYYWAMCKGKQLLVSLRDGLDSKICKDSKILNPIWLLQEFKILKLEGRTGTLYVCWQWSLIAEWTGAVKRASVRRLLPLCSDIREPSVRWIEPTYLLWQAEHSYWYTTEDRDTRGREPLNLKREPIVKLLTKIILKSKLGKYFKII